MNWIVLRTVLLLLASGTMFILATRTRNKTFIIASLVAVSLVYFLNNFFAQTTWPFRILYACPFIVFWGFIAIERLAPRSPIAGFTGDESLKSAAMIAFRGMTVTLGVLLYATLWKTWHPFSLSLSRKIPIIGQIMIGMVLVDLGNYWLHRAQHRFALYWKFHMPHHAPRELTVMANYRSNVLEYALVQIGMQVTLYYLLGLAGEAILIITVVSTMIVSVSGHANINFPPKSLSWINYIITTPNYHALHHSLDLNDRDKNLTGMFPLWDLLFGTFKMPGKTTAFGIDDVAFTNKNMLAQTLYPFVRPEPAEADAQLSQRSM